MEGIWDTRADAIHGGDGLRDILDPKLRRA